MVIRSLMWMPFWLLLTMPSEVRGGAREFVVTPGNISTQRLTMCVDVQTSEFGGVTFDIYVGAGIDSIFASHRGRLEIDEWTSVRRSSKQIVLVPPKLSCNLYENTEGGRLHYNFHLPQDWLEHARFQFQNSPGGIVLDVYNLPLKEFVVAR